MTVVARLECGTFDPAAELRDLLDQSSGDGAVVSFAGVARPSSKNGDEVCSLFIEHHPLLTQRSLDEIAKSAFERFDVSHVRVVHRCGTIPAGEPIVFAGAASVHRREAFDAADYLMDRLKTDAVFWKREITRSGSQWIEPVEADYRDNERWS